MVYCFRPQRSSLNVAMKEAKYFPSVDVLKDYAARSYDLAYLIPGSTPTFTVKDVMIENLNIDDERIGWTNCAYVVIDGIIIGHYGEKDE